MYMYICSCIKKMRACLDFSISIHPDFGSGRVHAQGRVGIDRTTTMSLLLRESKTNLEYRVGTGTNRDGPLTWSALPTSPRTSSPATDRRSNAAARASARLRALRRDASSKVRGVCRDLFLPIGYPASVAEGYLEYQCYDSLQGLCSYLRGVVATSAVLSATGVGDAEATAMGAAMVRRMPFSVPFRRLFRSRAVLTLCRPSPIDHRRRGPCGTASGRSGDSRSATSPPPTSTHA